MLTLLLATLTIAADLPEWPGFAGPNRNWSTNSKGLASSWPATGPKKLWSRALGEGYSGIAVDNGVLYTMYRRGDEEVVAALDAKSGKTIWEHPYDAKIVKGMGMENGPGPHSTPLVVGDRVFTVGILARLFAFNKKTGKIIWEKDLYKDFAGSSFMGRGYACSPLAYKDTSFCRSVAQATPSSL
jgi:outer membrane protein assembly factor BamB